MKAKSLFEVRRLDAKADSTVIVLSKYTEEYQAGLAFWMAMPAFSEIIQVWEPFYIVQFEQSGKKGWGIYHVFLETSTRINTCGLACSQKKSGDNWLDLLSLTAQKKVAFVAKEDWFDGTIRLDSMPVPEWAKKLIAT